MKKAENVVSLLKGGVFRQRDLIVLVFVVLATYLSFDSAGLVYTLTPCWYMQDSPSALGSSLAPIITDLDGDGVKEVVIITKDMKIKVLNAQAPNGDYSDIYSPEVVHSATLSTSQLNVKKGQAPVAIKTGYVTSYSDTTNREKVIVVLKEDWTIACFDAKLNLLWEKAVAHKTHNLASLRDTYHIADASISIAPLHFHNFGSVTYTKGVEGEEKRGLSGTGLIIIGASMALRDENTDNHGSRVHVHAGMDPALDGHNEHEDLDERSGLEHYNIYVLSAATGQILWAHDGEHHHANHDVDSMRQALPQHLFTLDKRDLGRKSFHGPGVSDWSVFKQSLIGELPHRWNSLSDGNMHLAHFERKHFAGSGKGHKTGGVGASNRSGSSSRGAALSDAAAERTFGSGSSSATAKKKKGKDNKAAIPIQELFSGIELAPLSQDASLPHDASEHTEYPNVIVAHTRTGIEVVALRTGDAVTALSLPLGGSFADVDGDGIVDQIIVLENKDHAKAHEDMFGDAHAYMGLASGEVNHCTLIVMSGLPARHQLFNGSVCKRGHSLQDPLNLKARRANMHGGGPDVPTSISAAPPVIMRTSRHRIHSESPVRDVVVAINAGVVTSYSGKGVFKWQITGAPTWSDRYAYRTARLFDSDADRAEEIGKHDNMHSDLLIMGESAVALISRDGFILAQVSVPRKPSGLPAVGDFDSDGVNDLIILTEDAILGYRLEVNTSTRGALVATLLLAVVAILAFVSTVQVSVHHKDGRTQRSFTSIRSTDEYHID